MNRCFFVIVCKCMKILQLTPGSGDNFYCENCIRDLALVKSLRALGHDVTLVPMYLPLQIKKPEPIASSPVFFGGINVFLQQKSRFFRKLSPVMDRWLDSQALLKLIARFSSMTSPRDLAETTISMLEGRSGHQHKEIDRLLDWLAQEKEEFDVIILSNILLSGLAEPLKTRLERPVVCLLQDESGFLDDLQQPWADVAWQKVRSNAAHIDHFIAVSEYFRDVMTERIGALSISVCYPAVDDQTFSPAADLPPAPVIGYMARMNRDNGLDILIDAFAQLCRRQQFSQARLLISGGSDGSDAGFVAEVRASIAAAKLEGQVEFIDDYSLAARQVFFQRLSLVCVPVRRPIACGMSALEAMAGGIPFLAPDSGVFKELAAMGCGIVYSENTAAELEKALARLLADLQLVSQLRSKALEVSAEIFSAPKAAASFIKCLEQL